MITMLFPMSPNELNSSISDFTMSIFCFIESKTDSFKKELPSPKMLITSPTNADGGLGLLLTSSVLYLLLLLLFLCSMELFLFPI